MAYKIECDRCKKAYNRYEEIKADNNMYSEWWRYKIIRDNHPYPDTTEINLCEDCLKELCKWLK